MPRGFTRQRIGCVRGVWAIPLRGHALRCNLRCAPISTAIVIASSRCRSLRAALARKAARSTHRLQAPCRAAPPKGAVPGTNKYSSDVMDHCATRAHCANPLRGSSAALRSVAAGTRNETALKRLGPARRATVAQSLRSLRPHHSRTAPGHSFRPRWLRCARVSQRTITSGQTLRTVQLKIGRSS